MLLLDNAALTVVGAVGIGAFPTPQITQHATDTMMVNGQVSVVLFGFWAILSFSEYYLNVYAGIYI